MSKRKERKERIEEAGEAELREQMLTRLQEDLRKDKPRESK